MNRLLTLALIIAVTGGGMLKAQSNPLSTDLGKDYKNIRDYFIRAAINWDRDDVFRLITGGLFERRQLAGENFFVGKVAATRAEPLQKQRIIAFQKHKPQRPSAELIAIASLKRRAG